MIQPLFIDTIELMLIWGVILLFLGGKKFPKMMHRLG